MNEVPAFAPSRRSVDSNGVSLLVGAALVLAGLVTLVVTWRILGDQDQVWLQLPYLVSGGFAGLGVVAVGLVVLNVQTARRLNAVRRHQLDDLLGAAAALGVLLSQPPVAEPEPAPVPPARSKRPRKAAAPRASDVGRASGPAPRP